MTQKSPPKVDQLLPTFASFDAIGTHARHIRSLLRQAGYDSEIFCENDISAESDAHPIDQYGSRVEESSLTIYHHSTGSVIPELMMYLPGFQVVNYHNITPSHYFEMMGDAAATRSTRDGIIQLDYLYLSCHQGWSDSKYNRQELLDIGIRDQHVLPILRDYNYLTQFDSLDQLRDRLKFQRLNLIFVGRITPNKCQHELLFLLKACQLATSLPIRLTLVGGISPYYFQRIQAQASALGLTVTRSFADDNDLSADVVIPGQLTDQELATFYRAADFFVCLSEHEGFCVPLVEAMFFGIPIIAHNCTAIPETLGTGGVLVDKGNPEQLIEDVTSLLRQSDHLQTMRQRALDQARQYEWSVLEARFGEILNDTMFKANKHWQAAYHRMER